MLASSLPSAQQEGHVRVTQPASSMDSPSCNASPSLVLRAKRGAALPALASPPFRAEHRLQPRCA